MVYDSSGKVEILVECKSSVICKFAIPMTTSSSTKEEISLKKFKEKVLDDFRTVSLSREISVQGRREVLQGKRI